MERLGFKHYWNYFKENFLVSLKSLVEYKANFYNLLIIEVFLAFAMLTYLLPTSFYGYLTMEVLKGNLIILEYFNLAAYLFLILLCILYFQWKIGLKKYEAFG